MALVSALHSTQALKASQKVCLDFIKPAHSVVLAAQSARQPNLAELIEFTPDSQRYARSCGLLGQLQGEYTSPIGSGKQGRTYSALARLQNHAEVASCNHVISNLVYEQFATFPRHALATICHVVGELHDNVASHSSGTGFSAAQKFGDRLHFAIADNGVGMPRKVRDKAIPGCSDEQAVRWCLEKGNTTASSSSDPMAQRLPEDCFVSPYPDAVNTITGEDNHMGEGLWQLREFVRNMEGELTIGSGDASYSAEKTRFRGLTCRTLGMASLSRFPSRCKMWGRLNHPVGEVWTIWLVDWGCLNEPINQRNCRN